MPAWEYLSKIWPTMHLEVGSLCCCWQPLDSPHLVSKVLVQEQNTNFSTGVLFSLVYCIRITSSTFLLVGRPPGGRVSSSFSPKKWRLSDLSLLRGFWASAMIISAKFIKILDYNNTNTQQRPAVQVRSEGVKIALSLGAIGGLKFVICDTKIIPEPPQYVLEHFGKEWSFNFLFWMWAWAVLLTHTNSPWVHRKTL